MAGIQDFACFTDDFFGGGLLAASGQGDPWVIADTSSSGTPTYVYVDGSQTGEVSLDLASTTEAENVCLYFGDKLCFDIDKLKSFECAVKMNQAALDSTTMVAFGLAGDRNDAIDSIAQAALFRVIGADSTTALVVETDDGTTDNNDVATGTTLINAYKKLKIDFTQGKSDVRFYVDGARVAASTTFSMAAYSGSLQPLIQLQKTSDANTDGMTIDYVHVELIR